MSEVYPIREVMHDCAEAWNDRNEPISPFVAAAQFFGELKRRSLHYDSYLQTVITGGGHAYDTSLDAQQAIQNNVEMGLNVAELLHQEGILDLSSSAEAAAMPNINGWLQDNWMTFWPLLIAKPDLTTMSRDRIAYLENEFSYNLRERIDYHGLDMTKYRDRNIDKSERLRHYINHANALYQILHQHKVSISPVWRTVGLVGIEESVGSRTEQFFARQLGVRTFQAALAKVEPLAPQDLTEQGTGERIAHLRSLGVRALADAPSQQFILIEDRNSTAWTVPSPH